MTHRLKYSELPLHQQRSIFYSLCLLNVLLVMIVVGLNLKVHSMVVTQESLIQSQIHPSPVSLREVDTFRAHYTHGIASKVFITDDRLIDLKAQTLGIQFVLTMKYPESWFPHNVTPQISLDNGVIDEQRLQYQETSAGVTEVVIAYRATVNTNYFPMMYPLDTQLIWLNLSAFQKNELNTNYPYLYVNEFHRNSAHLKIRSYKLTHANFLNVQNQLSVPIGNTIKTFHDITNQNYLLYSHKNVFSYLKTTQYIILAIFIALFALLINQQSGNAISGRISVIGSSVFSLSANVFQINSLVTQTSSFNLIDVITAFAGSVILICFLITVHTIKINDKFSFEASKVYDILAFRFMFGYTAVFFSLVYLQA